MPDSVSPPPAPPAPPTAQPSEAFDPLHPPALKPTRLEEDPNHLIGQMIAKRGQKKDEKQVKTGEKPPETPPGSAKVPEEDSKLGDLIAKTLGFRSKPVDKTVKKEPETTPATQPPPATPPPATPPAITPAKSIVSKRKKEPAPPDALSIASAAATAAVKAVADHRPAPTPPPAVTEDSLKDEDRHEFEVAKYLGSTNPKYKGAEKVVLDHVRKSEAYAARWEQQNPGKVFNPDDEDHNEFYEALQKPWSDHEFRMAENEIAAERVSARKEQGSKTKIEELTQDTARVELRPIAIRTYQTVAEELAKGVGDGILENINKLGLEKYAESDPITAGVFAEILVPLQPLIETIIEIDDPKGRIPINQSLPLHQQWTALLLEKEQQYAGVKDDFGKLFATRQEMHQLSPAERKGRFYLTADHLVAELVSDAIEMAKEQIKTKKAEGEKIALALGYVKASSNGTATPPSDATTPTTPPPAQPPSAPPTSQAKPISPSDTGSPRIDTPAAGTGSSVDKALAATANVLFSR